MTFFKKNPRGKKGEGRATLFKPVNLPQEVLEDLKLAKICYEIQYAREKDQWGNPIPLKLSYGQLLAHWMDNLERLDPEVAHAFLDAKASRASQPEIHPVDPTEGDVWEMEYMFVNDDGDEIAATADTCGTFVAEVNGFKVTAENMVLNDWELINDAGIELSPDQARVVAAKILEHQGRKTS